MGDFPATDRTLRDAAINLRLNREQKVLIDRAAQALGKEESGASRTYVVCTGHRVIGCYALAAGGVAAAAAPGRIRRNMPDPVPVMVLGRLAVDSGHQGAGLGRALLRNAILRTIQAANIAGIRALLVHAISEEARDFYERCDFRPSPLDPMTLMITLRDAEAALTARQ